VPIKTFAGFFYFSKTQFKCGHSSAHLPARRSILPPAMTNQHTKHLLIVFHSKTGRTKKLVGAAYKGCVDPALDPVEVRLLTSNEAAADDLLWADGLLLATPENFGYMSGAMKDFFDRTFYEVEGKLIALPYALLISAGNDGSGAERAIQRIANGYPFKQVAGTLISKGEVSDQDLAKAREIGMTLAAGLALGMY
jgi:hypothetical protein